MNLEDLYSLSSNFSPLWNFTFSFFSFDACAILSKIQFSEIFLVQRIDEKTMLSIHFDRSDNRVCVELFLRHESNRHEVMLVERFLEIDFE